MSRLRELAKKYGTDKCDEINFPIDGDLIATYEHILPNLSNVQKLLEIGIKDGASLRMWRDYFPQAEIFGVDIDSNLLINENRIHSYQCDQSSDSSWQNISSFLGSEFDVIIDDGSHDVNHQIKSFNVLLSFLKKGGLYVIEDVHLMDRDFLLKNVGRGRFEEVVDLQGQIGELALIIQN